MTPPGSTGPAATAPGEAVPTDLRRLLAFRAHGAARLLLGCRARLEDIEGAAAAGQTEVAVLMAYELVQLSLSVRGLRTEGELSYGRDEAASDPFAGVPADQVEAGLLLAARGREAANGDPARGEEWLERLRDHLRDTEGLLGYREPLPDVRSGSGLMKGFKLARTWQPHLQRVGLPDLLPEAWSRRVD
ncbi:hypothetical protein [Streptomyces subrutilus]|uniref:Uncharacterized protein n=1 Tax=Streptomyces subrutilus TaxID=36818 RepID=A0A918QNM8_9ACTN|nr:hypothetical protein [Streptomyces subrutilus]WSJ33134.1 hypothetical protein OG479_29695 [Streptomyces subrutilus]GGZ61908.1 hypothetical protein GCM10010371_21620 [Streptomyces subrutilus]